MKEITNKMEAFQLLKKGPHQIQHFCAELRDDTHLMTRAVTMYPLALYYASDRLKGDKEFVLLTIKNDYCALTHASPSLLDDIEVISRALEKSPYALLYASERLKQDKSIVLTQVRKAGIVLGCASHSLQDDEEVVSTAVSKEPRAMQYASQRLRGDKAFVLQMLKTTQCTLEYASKEIRALCQGQDPIRTLELITLNESLNTSLPHSESHRKRPRI